MGRNSYRIFLTALLLGCSLGTLAQSTDIKFHHINVENGLPSNTVNCTIADSRGFIWIATENGVGRYDGYSFSNFRAGDRDSLTISSNIVYVVFEDKQQRLWVGSERGLDLYNRALDRFDRHYFKGVPVKALYQDSRGVLWVGSDNGLYLYDEQSGNFKQMFAEMFDGGGFIYNTIPTITEDRNGRLWVGTTNGVYVIDHKSGSYTRFAADRSRPSTLSDNSIRKIVEDEKGRIWIATYGGGLNLYQPGAGNFKVYKHDANNAASISTNLLPTLYAHHDGSLWIGTDGSGIDILDPEEEVFHHVVHSPYNTRSLNNNVVRSIANDGRGGIWVGTYNGGVNFFNQNTEAFFHYRVPTVNGNSSVTSFAEEENGNLWIGTDGGGLCYLNRKTGEFQNIYHDEKNKSTLSDNRVIALLLDDKGSLWIGTYLGGLCRYDLKTKRFTTYRKNDGSGLSDNIVWDLLADHDGRIWIASNDGLNLYDRKTNTFQVFDIDNSTLSNNMVRCLFEDGKHRLWIGTQNGINILENPDEDFTVIKSSVRKENALSNDWIRTISSDLNGNLWIGTFAGGLNMYDELSDSFLSFNESDGLPDNMVSGILSDENNNIWVSTGRGLAHLDMKNRTFSNYASSDGLQDYQYNINSCFVTKGGEFLFGGNSGFTLFKPERIKTITGNAFPPKVALTALRIFNREIKPGAPESALNEHINESEKIVLDYDQNVLTFEFASLNFIQPEQNSYAYMLDGFEKDWNVVGNQRSATYTNLEPGNYVFKVKASNNDGVWSADIKDVRIEILPPFWGTWWFKLLAVMCGVAVTFAVVDIVRNRIRERIRVNKIIAELELKALIAQMNPHFIFNCLTSIQELIIVHKQDEAMHYLNQFSRLLRTVLQSSEKNSIPLDEELTLLELYLELESMRFDKQFHYKVSLDNIIDPEDIIIPSFLIQPFVENAIWHGLMHKKGERNLVVTFTLDSSDILTCKITDNGIGRVEAANFKRRSIKSYQSMGIRIIQERMELMKKQSEGFDLQIIDETDRSGNAAGTTVVMKIPVDHVERSGKQIELKDFDMVPNARESSLNV